MNSPRDDNRIQPAVRMELHVFAPTLPDNHTLLLRGVICIESGDFAPHKFHIFLLGCATDSETIDRAKRIKQLHLPGSREVLLL